MVKRVILLTYFIMYTERHVMQMKWNTTSWHAGQSKDWALTSYWLQVQMLQTGRILRRTTNDFQDHLKTVKVWNWTINLKYTYVLALEVDKMCWQHPGHDFYVITLNITGTICSLPTSLLASCDSALCSSLHSSLLCNMSHIGHTCAVSLCKPHVGNHTQKNHMKLQTNILYLSKELDTRTMKIITNTKGEGQQDGRLRKAD